MGIIFCEFYINSPKKPLGRSLRKTHLRIKIIIIFQPKTFSLFVFEENKNK